MPAPTGGADADGGHGTQEIPVNVPSGPVVDPALPIIDPHHHLWHGAAGRYLVDDLVADLRSGHDVRATVYIECGSFHRAEGPEALRPVGEVEFAAGAAAVGASGRYGPTRFCSSIVGFADLTLGAEADRVLEALVAAGNGRLKGVRHIAAHDPEVKQLAPPGMLRDERFRAGYARLAAHGLSFDAWLYHPQLGDLLSLAAAHPGTPVVVNHAGGPIGTGAYAARRDEAFAEWRAGLRALAALPHVYMKLGGFFMPVFGFGFETAATVDPGELARAARPIVETCIELFGPERCMFESNFPVTRDFLTYRDVWNCYKLAVADGTPSEKQSLFHDTARDVYAMART
ncbi:amidohydrolase family protein [Streptomyces sp. NPDC047002]|uniref:amidohydrolase family protein n=1 Tax=Streptomyces sp. NPDC047002 TaxID=3155475 RepID=UPI0034547804